MGDGLSDDEIINRVRLMSEAGVGWVRGCVEWGKIESAPGVYKYPNYAKTFLKACKDYNIKVIYVLCFGNHNYDEGGAIYTDTGREAFSNYIKFLHNEFKPYNIDTYEVWNEWDLVGGGFNRNSRPPEDYRELLKSSYKTLKSLDPNITVLGGAIANMNNTQWLKTVLDEGGLQAMDAIALHPYNHFAAPDVSKLSERLTQVVDLMKEYGEPVDIWITELGWYVVGENGTSSEKLRHTMYEQAAWNVRAAFEARAYGVSKKFIQYSYIDSFCNPTYNEANYGYLRHGSREVVPYAAKQVYLAVANMNKQITNAKYTEMFRPDDETYFMRYVKNDGSNVYAAWNYNKKKSVAFKSDVPVTIYDMYGNLQGEVYPLDGVINLVIGDEPCYLRTALDKIEFCASTLKTNNEYITAVYADSVDYEIQKTDSTELLVEVRTSAGGKVITNDGFRDNTASFVIETTNDKQYNNVLLDVRIKDVTGKLYFCGQYYVEILNDQFDVNISVRPYDFVNLNRWQAIVDITNKAYSKKVNGSVKITNPTDFSEYCPEMRFSDLKGGEKKSLKFNLPEMIKKKNTIVTTCINIDDEQSYEFLNKMGFAVASYAYKKPTIDGIIEKNEWQGTVLSMGQESATINSTTESFSGDTDLSAKCRIMWDEDDFYCMIDVVDDAFVQNFVGSDMWRGDSVQIGIDDANAIYVTEFTEATAALTSEGSQIFRGKSMAENKDINEGADVKIVRRDDGHTIYEMKIPWSGLVSKPKEVKTRDQIGFNMVVNDADKTERKGWLEFAFGIAAYKDATQFAQLILEKPKNN